MADAARYYAYPEVREQPSWPDLRVLPGGGREPLHEPVLGIWHSAVFRMFLTAAIVVACFAVVRVAFAAATVTTLMSSQQMTTQIEQEYSTGADLEVQRSVLASPTRIQTIAGEQLGMGPAAQVSYLEVTGSTMAAVGATSETTCALSQAVSEILAQEAS